MMTVVSMSSVTTGTTRRRRGEARRGGARGARSGGARRRRFDAVTTRETRANASVDGMKDARALAPTRGVGRERSWRRSGRRRRRRRRGRGRRRARGGARRVPAAPRRRWGGGGGDESRDEVKRGKDPETRVLDRHADLIIDAHYIPIGHLRRGHRIVRFARRRTRWL